MTWVELRTDVVVLACAASAGIHAALVPSHFAENTAMGAAFAAAAAALAVLAVVLTRRPASTLARAAAAVVFAGLIAGYALAVTTGIPVLHPHPEQVDGLALATKAIEAFGLLAVLPRTKGTSTWTRQALRAESRSR